MTTSARITYACSHCGATDCKLWRLAQSSYPDLLCAPCAGEDQDEVVDNIDESGLTYSVHTGTRTPTIGSYVPAVPTPDWTAYWGYTSIPDEGLIWWRYLPSLPFGRVPEPFVCTAIRGCTIVRPHAHDAWEINKRRLDAIADGTERGDPMG